MQRLCKHVLAESISGLSLGHRHDNNRRTDEKGVFYSVRAGYKEDNYGNPIVACKTKFSAQPKIF
jgi:hypothetical protein